MSTLTLIEIKNKSVEDKVTFSWKDSYAIKRILDVISSILAEEYILVTKQNPDVFIKHGDIK